MLPDIHLDTELFEDIVKKARSRIQEIAPMWTDYNLHDPGITILELFAFLKEAQQYELDQIDDTIRKKFLKLLGIALQPRTPAKAKCILHTSVDGIIPYGTKFFYDELCFEPIKKMSVPPDNIIKAFISGNIVYDTKQHETILFYPFGTYDKINETVLICLSERLIVGNCYCLTCVFHDTHAVRRNPLAQKENFIPLSRISLSMYGAQGYRTIDIEDDTMGFLYDGTISFTIPEELVYTTEQCIEGYYLKIQLEQNDFDVMPVLQYMGFHHMEFVQKQTQAICLPIAQSTEWKHTENDFYIWENGYYIKCSPEQATHVAIYESSFYDKKIIGVGNGFPNQCYTFPQKNIIATSVQVVTESIAYKDRFRYWTQVSDFDASQPEDCHYCVDEIHNTITFGDGIHGRVPETEIRLIACTFTEGERGNIKSGTVLKQTHICATLLTDAVGGCEPEAVTHGFVHANDIFRDGDRLVTQKDFETAVRNTPGLRIQNCHVLQQESYYQNEVCLVVQPYAQSQTLSEVYKQNIYRHLEQKRLIGTSIKLYAPIIIELEIYIEVRTYPQYSHAKQNILQSIQQYFEQISEFGAIIRYSALYAHIDSMVEVSEIRILTLYAKDKRVVRSENGDLHIPSLGVVSVKSVDCVVLY